MYNLILKYIVDPESKDLIYLIKKEKIKDSEETITETISEDIKSRDLFPRHFIVGLNHPIIIMDQKSCLV